MRELHFYFAIVLLCAVRAASAWSGNSTEPTAARQVALQRSASPSMHRSRRRRRITQSDMIAILDYHNQVRASVFPPAANMEYMVWDTNLARTAEAWAANCLWEHGPPYLLQFPWDRTCLLGPGGLYQSILQLVQPWYEEVYHYVFPYPPLCQPSCPMRCHGPMCTHYTQMVWASTNRVGCTVQTCYNMLAGGSWWREATFLVCNYSPKGNWLGDAPYRVGIPCSACPPGYGGFCSRNMCFPSLQTNYMHWFK